jgi:cyanate permease
MVKELGWSYTQISLASSLGIPLCSIIGPTLGGWVFDHFGSYNPLWVGFIFLNAFGIVLILMVKPVQLQSV